MHFLFQGTALPKPILYFTFNFFKSSKIRAINILCDLKIKWDRHGRSTSKECKSPDSWSLQQKVNSILHS